MESGLKKGGEWPKEESEYFSELLVNFFLGSSKTSDFIEDDRCKLSVNFAVSFLLDVKGVFHNFAGG